MLVVITLLVIEPFLALVQSAVDETSTAYLTGKYLALGLGILVAIVLTIYAVRSGKK